MLFFLILIFVLIILILNDFVLFYFISFYSFFITFNVYDFVTQDVMSDYF